MSRPDSDTPWTLLARGAGSWVGDEEMAPAPWAPDGLVAVGRTDGHPILGGRGLASDYTQEVGGQVTMTAHTVLRWDDQAGDFLMHFFSHPGGGPTVLRGAADGHTLVLEGPGPGGRMRQTFVYGDETMEVSSEGQDEHGNWAPIFKGTYRRA